MENQKHVFPIFFKKVFWHWRGKSWIRLFKSDKIIASTFTHINNTHQFHLLRKITICFLRLGTSRAAILIFILHIFPPSEWNLGPGLIAYDWGWDFELVLHKQNQSGLGHLPQLLGFPPSSMFSSILLGVFEECHQPERRQISLSAVLKSWLLLYDKLTDVYILEFFSIIQFPGNWLTFTLN